MTQFDGKLILGSRSPRRLELLSYLVPPAQIVVIPPRATDEAGFDGLHDRAAIEQRLREIARTKCNDVRAQLADGWLALLTADTVIVGAHDDGSLAVLGQPPGQDWQDTVREWFERYYLGRTHLALTSVCIAAPDGRTDECLVASEVRFRADAQPFLDWYLSTGEPQGKAGGYALQGAGSLFVEQVIGSISNVVGLPLRETAATLQRLHPEFGFSPREAAG